ESNLQNRIAEWQQFGVSRKQTNQPDTTKVASPTYLRAIVLPRSQPGLILDQALEQKLNEITRVHYPARSNFVSAMSVAETSVDRGRDWYELRWLHTNLDYECRWRVNSQGDFGFATQTRYPLPGDRDFWSLCDVALGLISTLTAARSWWEAAAYFGDAR